MGCCRGARGPFQGAALLHAFAVGAAAGVGEHEHGRRDKFGCPIESTHLLSPAQSCCYAKIVKDPSCCLDTHFSKGVTRRNFTRPGTSWNCRKKGCYDSLRGPRGTDQMTIPPGADCTTPRILYIHGGSWMYGSPFTTGYPQLASKLAAAAGAVVLMPDYPLIPYGNYTSILEAGLSALRWLSQHGPLDECRPSDRAPLLVAGDSSGGGTAMSLVLQLQARPELLPGASLVGAFMFSPWTNLMCNTPEYYTNAFAVIKDSHVRFEDLGEYQQFVGDIMFQSIALQSASLFNGNAVAYVGKNTSLLTDPIASSYFAGPEQFSAESMPSLFFTVGGSESIEGDTVRVANTAGKGGADVEVEVYTGMWHVFPMYSEGCDSGHELWAGMNAIKSTGAFVRRVVAGGKDRVRHGFPRIHHLYDPHIDKYEKVGQLLPNRVRVSEYQKIINQVVAKPWWVVLGSLATSAGAIFLMGLFLGNLMSYGGIRAYRRAARVAEFRRQFVEVPVGYVSFDGLQGRRPASTFMEDFIRGVPTTDERSWRVETAKAKLSSTSESDRVEAARAENAMWRRAAMAGGVQESPCRTPPDGQKEGLEDGQRPDELMAEVKLNPLEAWAVSTKEAKDGGIEAARRENMAWRLQNKERGSGK
ncbi:unnamed protein product [Prorocentrum cordatum]|uniref:Alpha/beta hydrolase fold-3 domain-containing protein n=1 Tax=Prorocentrum cordatum TaxID=2364126 RepID=A0ABN9XZH6_9DINO|nr:unnamed protein product [Polarella glacialis]